MYSCSSSHNTCSSVFKILDLLKSDDLEDENPLLRPWGKALFGIHIEIPLLLYLTTNILLEL